MMRKIQNKNVRTLNRSILKIELVLRRGAKRTKLLKYQRRMIFGT